MTAPLLQVRDLTREYQMPREKLFGPPPTVKALNGVSFTIEAGRSLGIVGESGSGKSTLARLVMALDKPTAGSVTMLGRDLHALDAQALRAARRDFQMVFQDPYGSLDPRMTVERIVSEPLAAQGGTDGKLSRADHRKRATEVLASVGPRLIVADEPVSALDVSVQAQVLNLMQDLQAEFGVTYMLISHDLAVVHHLCHEVAVLWQGRIVEQGPPERLFSAAEHPYTRALLDAVPQAQPGRNRRRQSALSNEQILLAQSEPSRG